MSGRSWAMSRGLVWRLKRVEKRRIVKKRGQDKKIIISKVSKRNGRKKERPRLAIEKLLKLLRGIEQAQVKFLCEIVLLVKQIECA